MFFLPGDPGGQGEARAVAKVVGGKGHKREWMGYECNDKGQLKTRAYCL
jgi:hypothetical protein